MATGMMQCPCGNKLGEQLADYATIRHRGRVLLVREVLAVKCEDCGRELKPPAPKVDPLQVVVV